MSSSVYTYSKTFTYTRLEALEDQFEHFLRFGGIQDSTIKTVCQAVRDQEVRSVGLYALNAQGLRILEVCLSVDWNTHGRLVLQQPYISRELTGWDGTMSPEVKVAGRRFSEAAKQLGTTPQCWVAWVTYAAGAKYGFAGTVPSWAGPVQEANDIIYDLPEATVFLRAAPRN